MSATHDQSNSEDDDVPILQRPVAPRSSLLTGAALTAAHAAQHAEQEREQERQAARDAGSQHVRPEPRQFTLPPPPMTIWPVRLATLLVPSRRLFCDGAGPPPY